jgi:hypothetical protein
MHKKWHSEKFLYGAINNSLIAAQMRLLSQSMRIAAKRNEGGRNLAGIG